MIRCPRCQRRLPGSGECVIHGRPSEIVDVAEGDGAVPVQVPHGWTLGRQLASGGTAVVFSVQRDGAPPAVLKWARWRGPDIAARFELEAEVVRTVGAPTTPAHLEHGTIDGWPYLIMEHVPGETFAAWMARTGDRGSLGEILALLDRLAAALATLHARGFVHRDLKPENILIGPRGVRLLDFGFAKQLGDTRRGLTQIGSVVGTVHYLAPEQLRIGGDVDPRADLYSFGVVAYEAIAGRPPFTGPRRAIEYHHLVGRPPSLGETRPVPAALDELVLACLAKDPAARPQSADELRNRLAKAVAAVGTLRGHGAGDKKSLGATSQVVVIWADGCETVGAVRAVTERGGVIVRRVGDGVVGAFAAIHHDAPLVVALAAAHDLATRGCRIAIHAGSALVRRAASGKVTIYSELVDRATSWLPAAPPDGVVMTAAAAALDPDAVEPARDVPGWFRERRRDRTDATDVRELPPLIGRESMIQRLVAIASPRTAIEITGGTGIGKSRVLAAVVDQLQAGGREVVQVRGYRRFTGDLPDDTRLLEALGGGRSVGEAIARAADRGVMLAIDDIHHCSSQLRELLAGTPPPIGCIVTSPTRWSDPTADDPRIAIELPALAFAGADRLLRDLLRPAHLLPNVLIERLAIRAGGNPGLLVGLAYEIKKRGGIRRHAGSNDWYVAADELDTLLSAPGPTWFAARALDELPAGVAVLVRAASALGPKFCVDELVAVVGTSDPANLIASAGALIVERDGWLAFADPAIQDAVYDLVDERQLVHARALAFWLARPIQARLGWLARLAHHALGAGDAQLAATCSIALARAARARREPDQADLLLARLLEPLAGTASAAVRDAIRELA
ncbi:MAG: protein kinase [Kofleriaceae bacterium]